MKAGVGEVEREGVFPINGAAHGIGGLAVSQAFEELEDGHEQEAAGRVGRLTARGKQGGEGVIGEQHAQFIADSHDRRRGREHGAGNALGFVWNEIGYLWMHAHGVLLMVPTSARSCSGARPYPTAIGGCWEAARTGTTRASYSPTVSFSPRLPLRRPAPKGYPAG
jgi:hypothetical protein